MKINQIWQELENDNSFSHGILYRRYSGSVLPDVFIAMQNPEKLRCIAAPVDAGIDINLSAFANLRDISIELRADERRQDRKIILFRLLNNQHLDIFSILCEDLIASISSLTNERQLVKELFNRFEKWKSLFDRASSEGLTPEEQRGLFGELFFLRKFLQVQNHHLDIITSWVGPEKQIKDFQHGTWAVEVKTTYGNNHQKIHIAGERQLDTGNLTNLILYHISLDARQESGETLNQIIDSVSEILSSDIIVLNRFRSKLLEGGYFDQHRHIYDKTGYFIREDLFYKVANNFPRIEESDIRRGTGDVQYSIIVSQCTEHLISEENVMKNLTF